MRSLIRGIERFERETRARYADRFAQLANGQAPKAVFLTCSDSRVVPNLVASAEPGELFVVRNVANLVAPQTPDGGDTSAAAAIWYAVEVLGVRDVVVCGHSSCGGMNAMLTPEPPPSAAVQRWLAPAKKAVALWREHGPYDATLPEVDQLSQMSTRHQLDNVKTHDDVGARVAKGEVRLHAWWFDIGRGTMLAYSERQGRYVPALDALAEIDVPNSRSVA